MIDRRMMMARRAVWHSQFCRPWKQWAAPGDSALRAVCLFGCFLALVAGFACTLTVSGNDRRSEDGTKADPASVSDAIDPATVTQLEIHPKSVRLVGRDSRQQLLATVAIENALSEVHRDATRLAEYRSADESVVTVSRDGVLRPMGTGTTTVSITVGVHTVSVPVDVVAGDQYLPIDFRKDIVPILTKAGCNGGGCHGKSGGRGGFQLSLFGFDPESDYRDIVKSSRVRRLFPAAPDHSLLLSKPAGVVPHGGGIRLTTDSDEYLRLRRWIENGAVWGADDTPQLVGIEVEPAERRLGHHGQQQIVVTGVYSDGTRRDVTRTTEFRSNETAVAEIDEQGLLTTLDRTGESAIVAVHHGYVGVSRITVPFLPGGKEPATRSAEAAPTISEQIATFPRQNFIDDLVAEKWEQLNIPPSELADDHVFLRRVTLQITGALPTPDEITAFVADSAPGKRVELVERLLDSSGYADHFAQKWSDILRNKRRGQGDRLPGTVGFHRWIRNAIARNMPYDQFVEEILTASGTPATNPKVQWYHEVRELDQYVDDTAQVFLGVRIGCARCHHHPFEKFSQEDWYGLAAFFSRVNRKGGTGVAERRANETIYIQPSGQVRHPLTNAVVPPHGLGADPVGIDAYDDPRVALAEWMRQSDNPYFARAFVNRMWAHFFSRGLVEPHDDLRVTNPATNEPLMAALSEEFVRSGFDMKHLIRLITTSSVYQLSSDATPENIEDHQAHSRYYPQRLKAEPLLDAIDRATASQTSFGGLPAGTVAVQLPDEGFSNAFLTLFGRPPRESACECEREARPNLSQSLFLMNDGFVQGKIHSNSGMATILSKDARPHAERVHDLFLTVLCRPPTADEQVRAVDYLESESTAEAGYRNLLWALMNTKEFLFIR